MIVCRYVLAQVKQREGRGVVGISLENGIITFLNPCKDLGAELTRVPKISANVSDTPQAQKRDGKVVPTPELTSQLLSSGAGITHLGRGLAFGGKQGRSQRTLHLELATEPLLRRWQLLNHRQGLGQMTNRLLVRGSGTGELPGSKPLIGCPLGQAGFRQMAGEEFGLTVDEF